MPKLEPRLVDQFLVAVPDATLDPLARLEHLKGSGAAGLCIGLDTATDREASVETLAESAHAWREAADSIGTTFGAVWVGPPAGFSRHAWLTASDAPTRRAAIADLITAVDCAGVLGAKTLRIDLSKETAPLGVDVPRALDALADAINAMLAYALAQEIEIECSLRITGSLLGTVGGAIAWIADLDFEEMVGLELDIASVDPLDLGAALWHDKIFSINVNGLVSDATVASATLWAVAQLEDAEWNGWRAVAAAPGAAPDHWGASARDAAGAFLRVQDSARDFLAEELVSSASLTLNGVEDSEPTLPTGRSIEALSEHRAARDPRASAPEEVTAIAEVAAALDRWRTA